MENQADYTIHSDGGSRGNPGPAAIGYVIYDANGETVSEGGKCLGVATNNQAEYSAILAALTDLHSRGLSGKIVCKLDSQLIVRQLNGEYKIKDAKMQDLNRQVQEVISKLTDCQITFTDIRREFNKRADALVNQALDAEVEVK